LVLDGLDLRFQVRTFVGGDTGSDNGTRDTASTTEGDFGGDKDVGDVLFEVDMNDKVKKKKNQGLPLTTTSKTIPKDS
jgi:hypothetical protein